MQRTHTSKFTEKYIKWSIDTDILNITHDNKIFLNGIFFSYRTSKDFFKKPGIIQWWWGYKEKINFLSYPANDSINW